jgi:hypothetical protein
MPSISVTSAPAAAALAKIAKQIPFAAATAINDLAFQVQRAENVGMTETFAHPRPFTARSVQVNRATKASQIATVFVRPEVAKYLQPYETGGLHVLPGVGLLKPVDIRLDAYGQLPKSTMAILRSRSDIYIGPIITKAGGTIIGVWQRLAVTRSGRARRHRLSGGLTYDPTHGALKLLIRLGHPVEVKKMLGFHTRAVALIAARVVAAFKSAIDRAIATGR